MSITKGSEVEFKPSKGKVRKGIVQKVSRSRGLAKVTLEGDPFPVTVQLDQLSSCEASGNNVSSSTKVRKGRAKSTSQGESKSMTTTRTSAKEMANKAKALGIEGWKEMSRAELAKAIKAETKGSSEETTTRKRRSSKSTTAKSKKAPARKKATSKKAGTRKAATKKTASKPKSDAKASKDEPTYTDPPRGVDAPEDVENPFRKGSNLNLIFPILVPRGGKRRTLAERLQKKVDLHPYSGKDEEIDLLDYDKRIVLAAQTLRDKHGYAIERKGRGLDGTIRVFVPGSEHDPRSSSNGRAKKGSKRSKKS